MSAQEAYRFLVRAFGHVFRDPRLSLAESTAATLVVARAIGDLMWKYPSAKTMAIKETLLA